MNPNRTIPVCAVAPTDATLPLGRGWRSDDGQSSVEYALVLLAVAAMVAVIATAGPALVTDLMHRIVESATHAAQG